MPYSVSQPHSKFFLACIAGWVGLCLASLMPLWTYQNQDGELSRLKEQWPASSQLRFSTQQPTLLMFVHPRCPCSRASMGEFARMMERLNGHVSARILFYAPESESQDWHQTDMWKTAMEIEGTSISADTNGKEATIFDVHVSGQTFLFDQQGELLFQGGLTVSRGHEGLSSGRMAVESLALSRPSAITSHAVYGCSLFSSCTESSQPASISGGQE